ncbi:2-dehydropantoate 2-reductase [Rhodovastum atsumiense]|uniref:2-dehydropantoate 2-reductase n=1 Tax=Rhodovastum atsumiense TaxID=504468 RepID=A0A5M6IS82_9PROT|nr:2-dehydropantoate 2-reductase [Rhodovastum atsumiense]KAA5610747.1 2-dehydropantoate 2-reductase [Rhodovastum atsumiense]CAH2604385.1 2-dehydropantoate 2-reductase [Rhodovastum atsumiense]
MRVCVFGAGAIGGHLLARLARGGAEVSMVARGAHLAAIRADGLRVQDRDEEIHVRPAASDDPAELGRQDIVLTTVKAHALPAAAAMLAPLLGPDTPVVFVVNGIPWWYFQHHGGPLDGRRLPRLDPDDTILRAVGLQRTIGGVVYAPCEVIAPGVVRVEGSTQHRLILGEIDGRPGPRVEALAEVLRAGGTGAEVTPRIRDAVWAKLMNNLSTGPIAVLSASVPQDSTAEPAIASAMRMAIAEGAAIAATLGCDASIDPDWQMAWARRSRHRPSILQDLQLGRQMEVDALYTVPLELARLAGVATPTLDLLVALLRQRARAAGLYAD